MKIGTGIAIAGLWIGVGIVLGFGHVSEAGEILVPFFAFMSTLVIAAIA